ncbi:hypothetical protein CHL67_01060 [Prosthecochloris sp. GSB1]|uniref:hypothetical protein n=1 Tax=Prosthecochloris sp. GSB1 TaxID=281093 RepID=UPI000B8CF8F9|nr:hypothetical protein [Prosthecochloris sp. GSB1]ASQ89696.1 hypothetical protein CHL67_01060 [Prosthecochloris sp. GSB1]
MKNETWVVRQGDSGNLEIFAAGTPESIGPVATVPCRAGRVVYQKRLAYGIARLPDLIRIVEGLHQQLVVSDFDTYSSLKTLELLEQGNALLQKIGS